MARSVCWHQVQAEGRSKGPCRAPNTKRESLCQANKPPPPLSVSGPQWPCHQLMSKDQLAGKARSTIQEQHPTIHAWFGSKGSNGAMVSAALRYTGQLLADDPTVVHPQPQKSMPAIRGAYWIPAPVANFGWFPGNACCSRRRVQGGLPRAGSCLHHRQEVAEWWPRVAVCGLLL